MPSKDGQFLSHGPGILIVAVVLVAIVLTTVLEGDSVLGGVSGNGGSSGDVGVNGLPTKGSILDELAWV